MIMPYGQFIKLADEAQKDQIKIETVQQALEKQLSDYGYVADDEDKFNLEKLITDIVNKSKVTHGFKKMSLAAYDDAYKKELRRATCY